jgi:twitching motility two-component system response regulator PilH
MDIVMPGLNGFQATRQLDKRPGNPSYIPVIVVTTKDQETDMVWAAATGGKSAI